MSVYGITEADIERISLDLLKSVGWVIVNGAEIAPGTPLQERTSHSQVILKLRLQDALSRLNPNLPSEALSEAFNKILRPTGSELIHQNYSLHRMLVDGVTVEYLEDGNIRGAQVHAIDFDNPDANDWLAVSQFSVTENGKTRRPDIVLFINGLPMGILELKNAADESATIWSAYQQLHNYQVGVPSLFSSNAFLIITDGIESRVGVIGARREWFKPWHSMTDGELPDKPLPGIHTTIMGLCDKRCFLDMIRDFLVFEDDGGSIVKKMAGYHQLHAVKIAASETLRAAEMIREISRETDLRGGKPGDRRIGVVWHTQGSGKSLTMAFYAGRIIREPAMENPTIVVLTDRNDLDDQLFETFSRCASLLRQPPEQANSRAHLRDLLTAESGGVVFTTIHKFFPEEKGDRHPTLSERRNIVVIADEAHRSQYEFIDGYARHMRDALPCASFIGFTGTPIEQRDANTRAVFGDYISIYDIQRSVTDGATVPVYYESRLAKLTLDETERPKIDTDFEEVTEGEEIERKETLKTKWAQLEALVGSEKRLELVAKDIVNHFRNRLEVMDGKGMIVCMSRRIAVKLYHEVVKLCPEWHADSDEAGEIKIVMTGSASDPSDWQPHIRNKSRREALARRFRDPQNSFRLAIVRDMWLTGFDAPSLHTMYIDKPMRAHGLMQAIARVNRVFKDKPGGLVVDYLGLAQELKQALATYTDNGGTGRSMLDQDEAIALMQEKHEVCCALFHNFDWSIWTMGTPQERLGLLPPAQEHILAQENGKDRFLNLARELSQAFTLSVPRDEAIQIRDDVAFFQAVQAALAKRAPSDARPEEELDHAVRQIISRAIISEEVVDIFDAAGIAKPDLSILSDEFLSEIKGMPHRNLAIELLQKLLKGEIKTSRKKNIVQARSFAEMLEQTLRRYQNRTIEAAQVIEELIALAREMREAMARGEELGLDEYEIAFYDALETNDSAVQILGDETLRKIARELVENVRKNVTIDWTKRENVRARMRVTVKRILHKYGYPPDKQENATKSVLKQAELLSADWAK